jgi:methionyl-tRNA synthetase
MKKFYITTAIDYINDKPHIGHAHEKIMADVLARYHRLEGDDVLFSYGTDEQGLKVYQTAQKQKVNIQEFSDEMSAKFKFLINILNLSINDFIRTTDKTRHWPTVQEIWQRCDKNDDIYKKKYKGKYCVGCEAFVLEKDLVDGKCFYHPNRDLQEIEEENYFFKLSKYNNFLLNLFKKNPNFVVPRTRYNENLKLLERGLEDISISRSVEKLPWGVPVPGDKSQVIYVWFDALINYLSLIDFPKNEKKFKKWWPADLHIVGKDIARFHVLLWPAILKSASLSLPKQVLVHGFITVNGQKISKSLGNTIDPVDLVKKYGTDVVRYCLLREIPSSKDGDFTYEKFEKRYNADLANDLGNLVQRVAVMINKYLGGKIPTLQIKKTEKVSLSDIRKATKLAATDINQFDNLINSFKFDETLVWIWGKVRSANQLVDSSKPWVLVKKDKEKLEEVLEHLVNSILDIAWFLLPFVPKTAEKIINIYKGPKIKLEKPLFPKIKINFNKEKLWLKAK